MKFRRMLAPALVALGMVTTTGVASASAAEPEGTRVTAVQAGQGALTAQFGCRYELLCTWHNGIYQEWYKCERIWLLDWTGGDGFVIDNQTPHTVTTFYNRDGWPVRTMVPEDNWIEINWDDIWSIQVC